MSETLQYYGIRHKATGELMPQSKRRGYSHWNPGNPNAEPIRFSMGFPRILQSRKQAIRCIRQWAANPNASVHFMTDFESGYNEETGVRTEEDGRTKDDLEVVSITLVVEKLK